MNPVGSGEHAVTTAFVERTSPAAPVAPVVPAPVASAFEPAAVLESPMPQTSAPQAPTVVPASVAPEPVSPELVPEAPMFQTPALEASETEAPAPHTPAPVEAAKPMFALAATAQPFTPAAPAAVLTATSPRAAAPVPAPQPAAPAPPAKIPAAKPVAQAPVPVAPVVVASKHTPQETEAETLLLSGVRLWNQQGKRPAALKLVKQSVDLLKANNGRARLVAEATATLADMYFATDQNLEAQTAVEEAMVAAVEAGQHALAVKLSNNLGAVLKKQGKLSDSVTLHEKTLKMASASLGLAHPYAQLARTNLVETMTEAGREEEALALLDESIAELQAEELVKAEALVTEGGDPSAVFVRADPEAEADGAKEAPVEEFNDGLSGVKKEVDMTAPLPGESKASASLRLTRSALIRSHLEKGRGEVKGEHFDQAEVQYKLAVDLCEAVYGKGSAESGSPIYALASCYRSAHREEESRALFETLYEMTISTQGLNSENAVGVSRQLYELCDGMNKLEEAAKYATAALQSMQLLVGHKVHPYLESFFGLAMRAKAKAGDDLGAEVLKKQYLKGIAQYSGAQQRAGGRGSPQVGASGRGARSTSSGGRGAGKKK